jgi:TRAP-type C4-dicarboxylate transport system permease small subunit
MRMLEKSSYVLARLLFLIAGTAIVLMMLLTCADVLLRFIRRPIPGTYELVCFLGAVAVAFAMAHTTVERGHVAVELIVNRLPNWIQGLIGFFTGTFGFILFALIAWRAVLYGNSLRATGEVSLTLMLPFYPFVYGIGFSAAAVCLVLLTDLVKNLLKVCGK